MRFRIILFSIMIGGWSTATLAQDAADTDTSAMETTSSPDVGDAAATGESAPQNESATPADDVSECLPTCRAGFLCHKGVCISACNPPCNTGYECNAEAACVPSAPVPGATSAVVVTDVTAAYRAQRQKIREQRAADRLKYRKSPRFLLQMNSGMAAVGEDLDFAIFISPAFGFKMNLTDTFGVSTHVGGMFGVISVTDPTAPSSSSSDYSEDLSTGFAAFSADAGVFFGPLGRFYLGPMGSINYFSPADEKIELYETGSYFVATSGWLFMGGIEMGLRFGSREQFDVNWRICSAFKDDMPFLFSIGFAYHILAQQ